MTLAWVRPKWAQKAYRSLLPFRIPYPESGLSDSPKPLRSRVYTVKRAPAALRVAPRCGTRITSRVRVRPGAPADDVVADPDPSSSRYSVSRALSTSLASRPSTMEAARIEATTTNKTIKVVPMEAMITQKRANRIAAGRARPILLRRGRSFPYIDLTNHESVPQSQTSQTPHSRSADAFAPVVTVEAFQLRAKESTVVETRLTVDAEEHLLGTTRMQVVVHHEIEKLPVLFADLIHELRERDAARDQTLARFVGIQLAQTTVGVPYDEPGGDVPVPFPPSSPRRSLSSPRRGRSPFS